MAARGRAVEPPSDGTRGEYISRRVFLCPRIRAHLPEPALPLQRLRISSSRRTAHAVEVNARPEYALVRLKPR